MLRIGSHWNHAGIADVLVDKVAKSVSNSVNEAAALRLNITSLQATQKTDWMTDMVMEVAVFRGKISWLQVKKRDLR